MSAPVAGGGVDVLFRELLDENRERNGLSLTPKGRRINEVRVAIAELIAADREYDEARLALDMAEARDHESLFPFRIRVEDAAERRAAALSNIEGGKA